MNGYATYIYFSVDEDGDLCIGYSGWSQTCYINSSLNDDGFFESLDGKRVALGAGDPVSPFDKPWQDTDEFDPDRLEIVRKMARRLKGLPYVTFDTDADDLCVTYSDNVSQWVSKAYNMNDMFSFMRGKTMQLQGSDPQTSFDSFWLGSNYLSEDRAKLFIEWAKRLGWNNNQIEGGSPMQVSFGAGEPDLQVPDAKVGKIKLFSRSAVVAEVNAAKGEVLSAALVSLDKVVADIKADRLSLRQIVRDVVRSHLDTMERLGLTVEESRELERAFWDAMIK